LSYRRISYEVSHQSASFVVGVNQCIENPLSLERLDFAAFASRLWSRGASENAFRKHGIVCFVSKSVR